MSALILCARKSSQWLFSVFLYVITIVLGGAAEVTFSRSSGTFLEPFTLDLHTFSPQGAIYYTTNGTVPSEGALRYSGPIAVESTVQIRARVIDPGVSAGPVASESFIRLETNLFGFSSDLPIVILENFRKGPVPANSSQPAVMSIIEPNGQRSVITNAPALITRAGIRIRGSSTQDQPKKNYAVETWDELDEDKDVAPLGMPPDSDWILYAPYNFDRALMRNPFIYALVNQIGRYAVRTRFVEVFVNTNGGALSSLDYVGVYVFMEKIKRGNDRVDVQKLLPEYAVEPEVSGGYMLKIDRLDPGDRGLSAGGQTMGWVYPDERNVTSAQSLWVRSYISNFSRALSARDSTNALTGYAKYIDVPSWIDHHIINEFSKNPDGFNLSTYMFKPRGGKLHMGPVWDFDRTMGPDDDPRAASPVGWSGNFNYGWWVWLFRDADFWQKYIDRWQELRRGPMTVTNLHRIIDGMAAELEEAQVRNFQKWRLLSPTGWTNEVQQLKDWAARRIGWIDSQYIPAPLLNRSSGVAEPGLRLEMASTNAVYYTLDGSDPRLPGGGISPRAILYREPVPVIPHAPIIVRAKSGRTKNPWSGPVRAVFVGLNPARLAVTELMYNPPDPPPGSSFDNDDFEFIEFQNFNGGALNLAGFQIVTGIRFSFPEMTLGPGQTVLIVKNLAAFSSRYATNDLVIAGEYDGNLSNDGETVSVLDPAGRSLAELAYGTRAPWPRSADGQGNSLDLVQPGGNLAMPTNWRASPAIGGSPGRTDFPRLEIYHSASDLVTLRFHAAANRAYSILVRDEVMGQDWSLLRSVSPAGQDQIIDIIDPKGSAGPGRFYLLTLP